MRFGAALILRQSHVRKRSASEIWVTLQQKFPVLDTRRISTLLRPWFDHDAGADIRAAELDSVAKVMPNLFGYHIVQLGCQVSDQFMATTRIGHTLTINDDRADGQNISLVGRCDALPIQANCIDVIVAPHVLEFADEPHAVLREAERVLIGEGHIVITGFNPWSICGIWRLLAGWRRRAPWTGRFLSVARIKDWLKLLGFELEYMHKTSFRPPFRGKRVMAKLRFMELLGNAYWPFFGNVYVIVAKKHVAAVTPLKASWQTRRRIIAGGVANPTTRTHDETTTRAEQSPLGATES